MTRKRKMSKNVLWKGKQFLFLLCLPSCYSESSKILNILGEIGKKTIFENGKDTFSFWEKAISLRSSSSC